MATSLLAKLKVNKPPAVKKDMEIRMKGKVNGFDKLKTQEKEPAEEDEAQDTIKKPPPEKRKVMFVDETKNKDFDRATFLKTFQRPKIVNEFMPAPVPVPAPAPAPVPAPAPAPVPVINEPEKKKKTNDNNKWRKETSNAKKKKKKEE